MMRSISHKGLKRLFEHDDPRGLNPEHVSKLRDIFATLNAEPTLVHVDLPAFRLHPLKGNVEGLGAVNVELTGA